MIAASEARKLLLANRAGYIEREVDRMMKEIGELVEQAVKENTHEVHYRKHSNNEVNSVLINKLKQIEYDVYQPNELFINICF